MSTIQEKLQQKAAENEQKASEKSSDAIVYRAMRAGRYCLDGKFEHPNAMGQFVAEGSEQRIVDLADYAARGFLIDIEEEAKSTKAESSEE